MDIQTIFNAGGTVIKNPNYTKKNKQPKFITVSDLDSGAKPDGSLVADIAYNAAATGNQDILGKNNELDKYIKAGITPNDFEKLDEYLPETQSALTKWGNGLAQTLVSELGLGIPKGFADLIDIVGQALPGSNGDYSNPVSQYLEQKQEEFRNFAPVYVDPNINISNGGLIDAGWWASNMPSIMSSLTLLLPGMAVVKPIQALGKALNVSTKTRGFLAGITGAAERVKKGEKLNKFQRFINSDELAKGTGLFLENGTTAAISRSVENYQEAHQTYDDMYVQANDYFKDDEKYNSFIERNKDKLQKEKIDTTNRDEVAKYVAKQAADETFKLDFANTAFDIIQLYALKDVWKGLRNAPDTSRKIIQANKTAAARIGKNADEIAKLESAITKVDKFKDKALNFLVGSKKVALAELSEGVEEAVNYIAQQEGMSLGNSLLTGEGTHSGFWEKTFGGYDGRLKSYLNSPQLWDAAFWGWMGGITFQGLGSATRRAYNTLVERAADKETAEVNKAKKPWYFLEQLPEVKRRIEDIRQRNIRFDKYKQTIANINKGIDVFSDPALQEEGQLNTEELKDAARKRAFNEYVMDMTMSALNSGNYDLLKAYLQDDNLRKGLIESGIFNSEGKTAAEIDAESKQFVDNAVRVMDETANKYDEELMALHHIMIGKKFKGNVPAEVLGIIANDNIYTQQAINQVNDNITATNAEIEKEKARISENPQNQQLDSLLNYEDIIQLNVYAQQLALLRKNRQEISKEKDSVSKRIALANIDTQIKSIESKLSRPKLLYATAISLREMKNNNDGTVTFLPTEASKEYYEKIIKGDPNAKPGDKIKFEHIDDELLNLSAEALTASDDNARHMFNVLDADIKNVLSTIKNISPKLNDLYYNKAIYNVQKNNYESYINRSEKAVSERIGEIMNTIHGARNTAITRAKNVLTDAYKKYGDEIRNIVKHNYTNNITEYNAALSRIPANERTLIKDALKVLDFTKSYNRNLGAVIEDEFDKLDRIEVERQAKDKRDGSVDNSINLQDDSATQTPIPTNPPQAGTNSENNAPMNPQGQPTPQQPAQPQQPQTPTPAPQLAPQPAPQQPLPPHQNPNVKRQSVKINTSSGYSIKDYYLLPDGNNYTIEDNDLSDYNNDNIYDKGSTVLTRPFEVESKPIVAKNGDKYELIQKGKLVNTDTEEYKQRKAKEAAQQQSVQQGVQDSSTGDGVGQISNQPSIAPANQPTPTPVPAPAANPQTGTDLGSGVINTGVENGGVTIQDTSDIIVNTEQEAEQAAYRSLAFATTTFTVQNINNLTDDDILDKYNARIEQEIDKLVQAGQDRNILEAQKDRAAKLIISRRNAKLRNSKRDLESSTMELIIEDSLGYKQGETFRTDYAKAVNDFLDLYCDEFGIETINGKKYLDLESIFRFINTISKDSFNARVLYYGVTEYLNSDEARNKYSRIDDLTNNKEEALKKINKSEEERRQEKLDESVPKRINLDPSAMKKLDIELPNNVEEEMDEAFRELQLGDEIAFTVIENRIVFQDSTGRFLGTNVMPSINSETGVRTMPINSLIYDLIKDRNGNTVSKLKDTLFRWFSSNEESCKELRSIIYSLAYDKLKDRERQELLKRLYSSEEIKQAIDNGIILTDEENNFDINAMAKHLGNLIVFRNTNNSFNEDTLRDSLDNWFDKVYDNYDAAIYLSKHPDTKIRVGNINDGEIIRNEEHPTKENCLPVTEAIAGGPNSNIHKITYTNENKTTKLSEGYSITLNYEPSSVHVAIPNRNGSYDFVNAFRSSINDKHVGQDAKDIVKAVRDQISKLYKDFVTKGDEESYNAFRDFVLAVFDKNNNSTLFYGTVAFVKNNILVIRTGSKDNEYKLAFYPKDNKVYVTRPEYEPVRVGNNAYRQQDKTRDDQIIKDTFDYMFDNLDFNINPKLINSDSFSHDANVKGIVSKSNSELTITVGDQSWTYKSFNDFVLNNNLVVINTKPNKEGTSNYERNTKYKILEYEIDDNIQVDTSSPVEDSEEESQPDIITPQINVKVQQALNVLTGVTKVEHKGLALYEIFNNNDKALKSLKELDLLPENIIFDENFNKDSNDENEPNAKINTDTHQITVGTKWLKLFETQRSYAIRVLIHEQIHDKLHSKGNEKYIDSIFDIFDEFKNSINRDSIKHFLEYVREKNGTPKNEIVVTEQEIDTILNQINSFKYEQYGEDKTRIVEEFLVDSLMNGNLVEYLNSVQAKDYKKGSATNLFQKILKVLGEIFGWNVEKGSLREKELYTLRKHFSNAQKKEEKTTKKETKRTTKKQQQQQPGLFDNIDIQAEEEVQPIVEQKQPAQPTDTEEVITDNTEKEDNEDNEEIQSDVPVNVDFINDDMLNMDISNEFAQSDDMGYADDLSDIARYSSTNEIDVSQSYTSEMQSIKDKAIADGTFMKAPNGNPTNLNERQWLQVRTKNFKDWFGDWESFAKFNNAIVIWGHPATGKTYLFKQGRKDIIDFDSEYKTRINKLMGLPEELDAKELRKAARKARKKEYHDHIMNLFDEAVNEAKRTGKKLLVSDLMLLEERESSIDVITNISNERFAKNSNLRGEDNNILWKQDINNAMSNVYDKNKIINTDNFISDDINGTNVSKVVDENGEPLVVRHFTDEEFTKFDITFFGQRDPGDLGKGFYFTADKSNFYNDFYGRNKMEVFLNIRNPFIVNNNETQSDAHLYFRRSLLPKITKSEQIKKEIDRIEFDKSITEKILFSDEPDYKKFKDPNYIGTEIETSKLKRFNEKLVKLREELNNLEEDYDVNELRNNKVLNMEQYDGVFREDMTEIVASYSNQIKSATSNTGEFSTTNDDIRYSSTNEINIGTSSSTLDMRTQLPIELRANFDSAVSSAFITSQCR